MIAVSQQPINLKESATPQQQYDNYYKVIGA